MGTETQVKSKGPLPFCVLNLDPFEIGVEKTLALEVGGRRVIYGQGVRPRIEIQAGQLEIVLTAHKGDVVAAGHPNSVDRRSPT